MFGLYAIIKRFIIKRTDIENCVLRIQLINAIHDNKKALNKIINLIRINNQRWQ